MRCSLFARVSTADQTCDNQLLELRSYIEARGWTAREFVDTGVSGSIDKRPALDAFLCDAKRRKLEAACWKLRKEIGTPRCTRQIQGGGNAGGFTTRTGLLTFISVRMSRMTMR
jgi:hypothetical protein